MSDFDQFPYPPVQPVVVEDPPAIEADAEPAGTEPPVVEMPAENPAVEVQKEPPLRTTPEGVILSKVVVSPEGVILRVED